MSGVESITDKGVGMIIDQNSFWDKSNMQKIEKSVKKKKGINDS